MNYRYQAMNRNGKEVNGFIDAKTESDVSSELKERGLFPVAITLAKNNTPEEQQDNYMKEETSKTIRITTIILPVVIVVLIIGIALGIFIALVFKI